MSTRMPGSNSRSRLVRDANPSWVDSISLSIGYDTEVDAYWFDDFPAAPETINSDAWNYTDATTFEEGLFINGLVSGPTDVSYRNATWEIGAPHRVEGIVKARIMDDVAVRHKRPSPCI